MVRRKYQIRKEVELESATAEDQQAGNHKSLKKLPVASTVELRLWKTRELPRDGELASKRAGWE